MSGPRAPEQNADSQGGVSPPSPFLPQDSGRGNAAWAPLCTPYPDPVRPHSGPHEVGRASVSTSI